MRQPTYYIPHGGGPCFFMDDPHGIWTGMEAFLRSLASQLPEPPKAILIVSGHWETRGKIAFTSNPKPSLVYDYSGFPAHTYQLRYDVPGSPELAQEAASLLRSAGIASDVDAERGLDHGVFVPLKVAFPDASIPVVEMSVDRSLDPALHLAAGKALGTLRDKGVLIIGAGMSFHNMRGYGDQRATRPSQDFDLWLTQTAQSKAAERNERLEHWEAAPAARFSHPREEHLLPLMVAAGASDGIGEHVYGQQVMQTAISGYRFS